MIKNHNNNQNDNQRNYSKLVKLISLSLGLSLILTVITSLYYSSKFPKLTILKNILSSSIYTNKDILNTLIWMFLIGAILPIAYYWWQAVIKIEENKTDQGIISIIHILIVIIFFLVDILGSPNFIKTEYLNTRKVYMIFIFYLLITYTFLRMLNAFLNWLSKDGLPRQSNAPRISAVLALLGTILGYLLHK